MLFLSPPGRLALVDRWRVLTGDLARFVAVVAGHDRGRRAAILPLNLRERTRSTSFLQVPFPHLLVELNLVDLAVRPAHVKDVRVPRGAFSSGHQVLHETLEFQGVEGKAARKFLPVAVPRLDPQAVEARLLAQVGDEGDLVGSAAEDPVAKHQK